MGQQFENGKAKKILEDEIEPKLVDLEDKLDHSSWGLAALKILIDALEAKLDDGTIGLSALKALIDALEAKLDNATWGLAALRLLLLAVEDKLDYAEFMRKLPSDPVVDAIAAAGNQNTTELQIVVPATPLGFTIQRAMVACFLTAINKTDTAHQIDVTQQARVAAGAWGNYFAATDYIGFPAVTNATTGDVPMSDVSALVTVAGTYGFRLTVNQSGGANNVRYKTQYLLIVAYRMS